MRKITLTILPLLALFSCSDLTDTTGEESSGTSYTLGSEEGAFKFVNSWGDLDWEAINPNNSNWENICDGHYWMEYDELKNNGMYVWFYTNDYSEEYDPSAVAVFHVNHDYRDEVKITLGLRDSNDSTIMSKSFETEYYDSPAGGHEAFPDNDIVLDLGEFVDYLDDDEYDLFLTAENLGRTEGEIESFSLELYNGYDSSGSSPSLTLTYGSSVTLSPNSAVTMEIETAGNIDTWLDSLSGSSATYGSSSFTFREMTDNEIAALIKEGEQSKSPDTFVMDSFGTGWMAPTTEEWEEMSLLTDVDMLTSRSGSYDGVSLDDEVDLSASDYFPPIGNQGSEGSCVPFSVGYYIHTYMEAREHGWDLSDTTWDNRAVSNSDGGEPESDQDKIFSPDFIYHQINQGGDNGSSYNSAVKTLIRQGCATWETMPYDTEDSTIGFFVVDSDLDVLYLKYLLSLGYPVCTAIDGGSTTNYGLYDYLDENDVVESGYTFSVDDLNHAQTIVGYKEGDRWDSSNPDY